jgi:hypothetical protein
MNILQKFKMKLLTATGPQCNLSLYALHGIGKVLHLEKLPALHQISLPSILSTYLTKVFIFMKRLALKSYQLSYEKERHVD